MYSKFRVKVGKESFIPLRGVAQGSMISPALFNIYVEPLLHHISQLVIDEIADIFAYADDILIIADSIEKCSKIIEEIQKWSQKNGLLLNKKKTSRTSQKD